MTNELIKAHLDEKVEEFKASPAEGGLKNYDYLPHPFKANPNGYVLLTLFPKRYFNEPDYHHARLAHFHSDTFINNVLTNLGDHTLTNVDEGGLSDSSTILYKTETKDNITSIPSFLRIHDKGLIEILFPISFSLEENVGDDEKPDFKRYRIDINDLQTKTEEFFKATASIIKGLGFYDGEHIFAGALFGYTKVDGRLELDHDLIPPEGFSPHSVFIPKDVIYLKPSKVEHLEHNFEGGRHLFLSIWRTFKYENTLKKHSDNNWYRW